MEAQGQTVESMLRSLQLQMEEHIEPGAPVTVYLYGLDREVSNADVERLQAFMVERGLPGRVRFGSYGDHPNALELTFARPSRNLHPSIIPFALIMVGGLALIGVLAFAGFSLSQAISKNLGLIIVVGAAVVLLIATKGRLQFGDVTVGGKG